MVNNDALAVFRKELEDRQSTLEGDCVTNNPKLEAFAKTCSEILCESGMLVDEPEFLMIDENDFRLDAICWPDEDHAIVEFLLFIRELPEETLKTEIYHAFEKCTAILRMLCKPTGRKIPDRVDNVIRRIHKLVPNPDSILVRIISDASIGVSNVENKLKKSLRGKLPEDIHTDFRLCDIDTLCQSSEGAAQGPSIDFSTHTIRCFLVNEMTDHDVYLAAFPGNVLAATFKEHGQRLLQKNVRAFLGLKGKKNKNIAQTIVEFPQRFLAYNNGLTITASNIHVNNNVLEKLDDMQVVNGGQTIAVLANGFKENDPKCLASLMVSAKIIHVKNVEQHMEWIEKIAETSNTQNAIKDADLSSYNPVYIRIKTLSQQLIFRKATEQYKWYFSRVRNEYEAELSQNKKRGHVALKFFEDSYPKDYVIEKGHIARVECVFSGKPWIASKGEAKSHAHFISGLSKDYCPTADWYRNLTGKILLIRKASLIAKTIGIQEGRSCIVEYACALFSFEPDFVEWILKIQNTQNVPDTIDTKLVNHLTKTNDFFTHLDISRSIKEHAKREETWIDFKDGKRNDV